MADIELVIKLSEEEYKYIKGMQFCILGIRGGKGLLSKILNAVRTGTPLPKGHGGLLDIEEVRDRYSNIARISDNELETLRMLPEILDTATIIIEADKAEGEG